MCVLFLRATGSHEDLENWLSPRLLRIVSPPRVTLVRDGPSASILIPTTIRIFIRLLIRVIETGCSWSSIPPFPYTLFSWCPCQHVPLPCEYDRSRSSTRQIISNCSWVPGQPISRSLSQVSSCSSRPACDCRPHFPLRPIPLPSAVKCKPTYRWKNGWFGNPNLALLFLAPGKNPNLASGFTACNLLLLSKPEGESVQIVFSILSCDVDTATRRGSLWMHIHHFESMKQAGWTNFLWRGAIVVL
ncbi:hypothetical protein B0H15DRAFT_242756 [Mycena belliarum]|uniref:Uncharacterized protein n=1 Tax=Mycena belliarum TaxID=1033014 RepID=A0AAD6XKC2_9AGAR|nr:hypothetical protein B0H15DRAFT_242756 [Mycena belliae]